MFRRQLQMLNDESVSSYIIRLAHANYYGTAGYIIKKLGGTFLELSNNIFYEQELVRLSSLTMCTYQKLNAGNLSSHAWDSDLANKIVMKRFSKLCPCCIKQQDMYYHKWIWGIHPVTICLEHNYILIDRCLNCDQRIKINLLLNGFCMCGTSYKTINEKKQNANKDLFESQLWLQNTITNTGNMSNFLNQFSFVDFINLAYRSFHLLEGLDSFLYDETYKIESFHNKKNKFHGNYKYAMAFGNVYWMYQNFPINFCKILDAFQQKKDGQLKYIQKSQFEELFKIERFENIKQIYESYWIEKCDKGLISTKFSVFKNDKSLLYKRKTISKEELKKVTGWSYPKIESLVSNNSIIVDEVQRGTLKRYVINRESIEKLNNRQMEYANQKETASVLGITKVAVTKLLDAKLLQLTMNPKKQVQIKKQSIKRLMKICKGIPTIELQDKIGFRDVLIKYSVNGLTIVQLIQWIKANQITPYSISSKNKLSELYFNKYEISLCLQMLKMELTSKKGYYFSDVCKLLKIGEKTLWLYVKHELIVPDETEIWKDGRKRYFFKKQKIEKFINEHITIRDAAIRFNISQSTIRMWFKKRLIRDATGGVSKSFLLNVQDIIKQIELCYGMTVI